MYNEGIFYISLAVHITFDDLTREETIDLYEMYRTQFGTSIIGMPMIRNNNAITTLPVLPADELGYYIAWYDNKVFEDVIVSDAGILTCKIISATEITMGTFMNIVFAVKT